MDSGSSGDQAERFARALSSPDPDAGFEPELAIVAALRTLGPDTAPDDAARDRMRARIVAKASPAVSSRRGRFAVAVVAALALVLALGGMSLLLSRDALPGDALYGVKRTAEAASLGLTFGDESKALKHLEFANARVGEMETLAQRHPDPADAPVGGYLTALTDFDTDAAQASRQLIALATRGEVQQLDSLRAWVAQQSARLAALGPRMPGPVNERATKSRQLLDKIAERSTALLGRADCYQITTGGSDDIGALPATGLCHRDTASSAPTGPTSTQQQPRVKTPETPPPPAPGVSQAPVVPTPPVPETTPQVPSLPVPVPELPARPSAPSQPQLPIPILELPSLLPGLPAIRIG